MSLLLANLPRAGLLIAVLAAVLGLHEERVRQDPTATVALEDIAVQRICAKEEYPSSYFWERFYTMGGRIALVRSEPLGNFLEAGHAVRFSKEEVERLHASGVAAEGAPLAAGAVWTEDEALATRFKSMAKAARIEVPVNTYKGRTVFAVPNGFELDAGFDPIRVNALRTLGLIPAYAVVNPTDLRLALEDSKPSIFWIEGAAENWTEDDLALLEKRLIAGTAWLAWDVSPIETLGTDRVRRTRFIPSSVASSAALAASRGGRFLLFELGPADSVEASLNGFRDRFSKFRKAGLGAGPVVRPARARSTSVAERWVRRLLLLLTLVLGPFAALRISQLWKSPGSSLAAVFVSAVLAGLVGRLGAAPADYWMASWYPVGGSWFARHWLEIIVGWPALVMGVRWVGFTAPLGVIWVVSNVRLPVETALFEVLFASAVGLGIGGGIFLAKRALERR